jgi:multiple sugar transport system permease protein
MRRLCARHVLPAAAALLFVAPLYVMVVGSLRPAGTPPPQGLELVPPAPTVASYARLPELIPLATYLRNSLLVAAVAVPLTVLVASWAGFGIRLLPGRAQRRVVIASLLVLMVPVTAVWATRFEVFRLVGAIDTFAPLIAPALMATSPLYVLLYAWGFTRVGQTQLEAARLEGASLWRIWRRVALPQVRAATAAVVVLAFTFHWANFIDALLYLTSQGLYTLPLGLRFLQLLNPTDWPLLMAGAVVVTVPPVIVFLLGQRLLFGEVVHRR